MAIVLQELVGNKYEDVYFPHISGTAQSYNYYPFGKIKPKDGTAVTAIGLGIYVVEGVSDEWTIREKLIINH